MPPVVFQDFELRRKYTRLPCFSSRGTCLHLELRFHSCFMGPGPHSPEGARSVTAGGGEVQEGGERLPGNQVCWSLAGISGGTQRCGDAVTAPGQRRWRALAGAARSAELANSPARCGREAAGPPAPSCAAAVGARREHICTTSLFTGKGLRWSNDFTLLSPRDALVGGRAGNACGHAGGSASSGLPCRGFTWGRGTPQSHFPSCHQKRRSCCEVGPSETGPGEKNRRGFSSRAFKGTRWREKTQPRPSTGSVGSGFSIEVDFAPQGPFGHVWKLFFFFLNTSKSLFRESQR